MALHPQSDGAIEEVVNEAIVSDLYDSPVEVELSNLNASDTIKKKIREEFRYLKELMDLIRSLTKFLEIGILMVVYFILKL